MVLSWLPMADLARVARVSSSWAKLAVTDSLWNGLCDREWRGRHVAGDIRATRDIQPRAALRRSLAEARVNHISKSELVNLEWSFRFKRSAGSEWYGSDPWWLDEPARTLRFLADGTVRWAEREWDGLMRWKLEGGSILRVKHRELGAFPGERLVRHPNNWGFIFNSPWVVYCSFPLTRATDDKHVSDRSLARHIQPWQWREADEYNMDPDSDSDSDNDAGPPEFPGW